MIGAYQSVQPFAYPGWRLTVPGGPAGGHYKGFTHSEASGTTILPGDDYETDRGDGMSSHDAVHASQRNPRGIYRSSGEVPPRPNASGAAHTYRDFQTKRHAGTSVAPGSFPADFHETGEDDFLSLAENAPHYFTPGDVASSLLGMGVAFESIVGDGPVSGGSEMVRTPFRLSCPAWGCGPMPGPMPIWRPNTTTAAPPTPVSSSPAPSTGATSAVNQPPATPAPAPPSPSIPVYVAPPVSPAPAPTVATNEVVPLNDGSGNYLNVSTGQTVPASSVMQNPATGQLSVSPTAPSSFSSALSWLEQNTIWSAVPNWGVLAAAAVGASLLLRKHR